MWYNFILVLKRTEIPNKLTKVQWFRKKTTFISPSFKSSAGSPLLLKESRILFSSLFHLPSGIILTYIFKTKQTNKDCRQISIPDNTKEEEGIKVNQLTFKQVRWVWNPPFLLRQEIEIHITSDCKDAWKMYYLSMWSKNIWVHGTITNLATDLYEIIKLVLIFPKFGHCNDKGIPSS